MQHGIDMEEMIVNDRILMAHGGGGRLTSELISNLIIPRFSNDELNKLTDVAILNNSADTNVGSIAVTTDCHVVKPIFFPGGDIGRITVAGTVNDLLAGGAYPEAITLGIIIEEGFLIKDLELILDSMAESARQAGVKLVAGDTKVVEKGSCDGVYTCSTGVGSIKVNISPGRIEAGDVVIISGTVGDHGTSIMMAREDFNFKTEILSDVAPLNEMMFSLWDACGDDVHFTTDPTRGGLAAAAHGAGINSDKLIEIDEKSLPVKPAVNSCCELLGLDPLEIANEGKMLCIVAENSAHKAVEALRSTEHGSQACIIGKVTEPSSRKGCVLLTRAGGRRIVDVPYGENLPRIC